MKKTVAFFFAFLMATFLIGCGGGSSTSNQQPPPPPPPQIQNLAFLTQGTTPDVFTPVRGTFTNSAFSTTVIKDPTTGNPVEGPLWSIILSNDQKKATFDMMTEQTGAWDIYIANTDGTQITQLTNDADEDDYPSFSPDGQKIVFMSYRMDSTTNGYDTMTIKLDGTGMTNLTAGSDICHHEAVLSPDGKQIAFAGHQDTPLDIYVMNADGTNAVNLTKEQNATVDNLFPAYSPDGKTIAFTKNDWSTGSMQIWVMNVDGTNPHALITTTSDWLPRYLGNNMITFNSHRDGNAEIYNMKPDGSAVTRLTNNGVFDSFSASAYYWSWGAAGVRSAMHTHARTVHPQSKKR